MEHMRFDFSSSIQEFRLDMSDDKSKSKRIDSGEDRTGDVRRDRRPGSADSVNLSESRLTAVERAARELYRPAANAAYESAGDLSAVNSAYESARVADALSRAAIGLKHINNSLLEIQRSPHARYMLGSEFAIVAIVAIAGIAKRRADLSQSEIKAVVDGDESRNGQLIYRAQKKKVNRVERALERRKDPLSDFAGNHPSSGKDYPKGRNVPDWLISLDTSVAKEAGYLFNSVLKRPTVLMTLSDTFVSLGEQHFFDGLLSWLIVDLNKNRVTEFWKGATKVVAIANGELVELPVWEDIVEFYQNKPKQAKPDNLLTVVLKRNLDRELIEAALADVVVPGDAKIIQGNRLDLKSQSDESVVHLEDILPTMFRDD